jgi:hypothetical protein
MQSLKVAQLKDLCKKHGLAGNGKKADLLARLQKAGVRFREGSWIRDYEKLENYL